MRYKATSLFLRGPRPPEAHHPTPRQPSRWADWSATIIMVLGLPALLVPLLIAFASSASLSVTPNGDPPGTTVQVTGSNLPGHMRGTLTLDGGSGGIATFRTDRKGSFTLRWTIPASTAPGTHTLTAIGPIGKGSPHQRTAPSTLASTTLTVVSAKGTPSASPTASPTPTTTVRPTPTPTARPTPTPTPRATPTPTPTPQTGAIDHVFVIVMENHSYNEVWGTSATPYTNSLVATWAHASNYFAITHPSLPDYLDLYAGSNHGITTDCDPSSSCHISGTSLLDEFLAKGLTAKGYFDGMTTPCTLTNPGTYRAHHDPLIYFDDMWTNTAPGSLCYTHVRPFSDLATDLQSAATSPNWAFVKPDNCHDTHDCSITTGDTWLSQTVPTILNSPACTVDTCLVQLTWDEDDGSQGNQVLTVFAGSGAKSGFTDATAYNHYSLLRTTEDIFGLPHQANDATATSMKGMLR